MFTRAGTTWSAQGAKLIGAGESGEGEFGQSVALAVEGTTTTALMGGPGDAAKVGAVWMFTRATTTWSAGRKLKGRRPRPAKASSATAWRCPSSAAR